MIELFTKQKRSVIAVFDTDILIDFLNGVEVAIQEINKYQTIHISILTWMEVLSYAKKKEEKEIKQFLDSFEVISVTPEISDLAVKMHKKYHIALPYAIIWASAISENAILITRDIENFPALNPTIKIPYTDDSIIPE